MSELKQYLDCFFCCSEQVKHLDGCDNGAYVINKGEMKKLLSIHSAEQEKVIGELVDKIQLNTEILTAIMERKPLQGSDYHAISCTIKNNELLTAKHKQSKGE